MADDDVQKLPPGWRITVGSRDEHDQTSISIVAPNGSSASLFARGASVAEDVLEDLGRAMKERDA